MAPRSPREGSLCYRILPASGQLSSQSDISDHERERSWMLQPQRTVDTTVVTVGLLQGASPFPPPQVSGLGRSALLSFEEKNDTVQGSLGMICL